MSPFFLNTIPLFLCVPLVDSYTVVVLFSIYLLVSFFGGEKKKKMFSVSCFSEFELVGFLDIPCSLERTAVNSYP